MPLESQVEKALQSIINSIHHLFATNFTDLNESRDLNPQENELLLELERNSPKYNQLAGVLAIQSYANHIISLVLGCEPLLQITSILFENLLSLKNHARKHNDKQLNSIVSQSWANVSKIAEIIHQLFPNSPLVAAHNQVINGEDINVSQAIYSRIYDENADLKAKLQQNDRQLLQLQLKLSTLLRELDGCEGNVDSSVKMLQLRQRLAAKQQEIQRMNSQFSIQIQKYNTVYEVMKRQIEQLKECQEVDIYDMVQRLQTEIVKLRQEKQRDELVIHELKQRLSNMGSSSRVRPNAYSRGYY